MPKLKFDPVEKLLLSQFLLVGINLDRKHEINSYFRYFLVLMDLNFYATIILMLLNFLYIDNLMDHVILFQVLCLVLFGLFVKYILTTNKDTGYELIKWMRVVTEDRNLLTKGITKKTFKLAPKYSIYLIRFAQLFCGSALLSILGLGSIIAFLLPRDDEYGLPLKLYYGWLRPTNYWKLMFCLTNQFMVGISTVLQYNAMMSIGYLLFYHIILRFDVLIEFVGEMNKVKLNHGYDAWIKKVAMLIVELRM